MVADMDKLERIPDYTMEPAICMMVWGFRDGILRWCRVSVLMQIF